MNNKAFNAAFKLMTPNQRAKLVYNAMYAQVAHETSKEPLPPSEIGEFSIIETDIKVVRLDSFIKMCVHNDFSGIVLAGNPDKEQLNNARESIMFQYHDTIREHKTEHYKKQTGLMNSLSLKINGVNMIITALSLCYYLPLIEELKQYGYTTYQFTEDSYKQDLERIKTALKRDKIQHDRINAEISKENRKGGGKMTEDSFYDSLAELRKFENYQSEPIILAKEMTVYGYCQALKRYNAHIELLNKQNNKEKR